QGESRMIRMQFDGSSRAEAIKECSSAVEKLMEYLPVEKAVGVEAEVVQGSVSIKHLTQHFLGETAVTLPQVYHHDSLAQGDLEPILRVCLLDPSFPAFVEKVEGELRKLLQE
uniref:REC114 meiotic recombination protein n=1 Tax=Seriola lalandi dorsalis TaxID=1841481 RepID=A0A3B4WDX2_SERLL